MATSRKMRRQPSTRTVYRRKLLEAISALIPPEVVAGRGAAKAKCWVGLAADADGVADGLGRWPVAGPEVRWFVVGATGAIPADPAGRDVSGIRPRPCWSTATRCWTVSAPTFDPFSRRWPGQHWLVNGFCPFAADGSRSECPRTRGQPSQAASGRAQEDRSAIVRHYGLPPRVGAARGAIGSAQASTASGTHLRSMLHLLPGGQPCLIADAGVCRLRVADRDHRPGVALSDPGGQQT